MKDEIPVELQGSLTHIHYVDLANKSGLTAKTILENQLRSLNEEEVRKYLGLKASISPGLLFQYLDEDGKYSKDFFNIRLDTPLTDKNGKKRRYMRPRGVPVMAYIPKGTYAILEDHTKVLFFVEGEKKALSLTQNGFHAIGFTGAWGFSSQKKPLKQLRKIKLKGRQIFICYDGDKNVNSQILFAQDRLAQALIDLGADVFIIEMPPSEKPDEFINKNGPKSFEALVKNAKKFEYDKKVEIILPNNDLPYFSKKALDLISQANNPPFIFRQGNEPVRLQFDSENQPRFETLDEFRLRYHLCRLANWVTYTKSGNLCLIIPTLNHIRDLLAIPQLPFPQIRGISKNPLFTREGLLECQQGYSERSGLFHFYPELFGMPKVNKIPKWAEVERAKKLISDNVFVDFPFVSTSDLAHAFVLLFLPFMRDFINGPCPLFLIEKSTPGTGATLLVQCLSLIATGSSSYSSLSESHNEEEFRKRLTSILRCYPTHIVLDNLSRELKSGLLASLLTDTKWSDRLLGSNDHIEISVRGVFIGTANNPLISDEITRRSIRIRMDARMENPHLRSSNMFKHPNLLAWIKTNRSQLVWAVCTIIQYWISKGAPRSKKPLGMFEDWTAKCGGLLQTVKISGFLENLPEFYADVNTEKETLKSFIHLWYAAFKCDEVIAGNLFDLLNENPNVSVDLGPSTNERSQRTRFGFFLSKLKDRTFEVKHGKLLLTLRVRKGSRSINHTTSYRLEVSDTRVFQTSSEKSEKAK